MNSNGTVVAGRFLRICMKFHLGDIFVLRISLTFMFYRFDLFLMRLYIVHVVSIIPMTHIAISIDSFGVFSLFFFVKQSYFLSVDVQNN